MRDKFLKVAQDGHFFDKHDRVLVAVSGGLDSLNLLQLLYECRETLEIDIGIVHVNHQQREESSEEEEYIRQLAKQYHLPVYVSYFEGVFSERAARQWRYDFFAHIMSDKGYTALVTAHHADDQVETIFMRLIRGSRLRYLSSIKERQSFAQGELIRPLLSFRKCELEEIVHFEDKSNSDGAYFRNRVRHKHLPAIKKENPQIEGALLQLAEESQQLFQALRGLTKDIDVTDVSVFQQQEEAVQLFLLEDYLTHFPELQITRSQFNQLLHILRSKANYSHEIKAGYALEKDYRRFCIRKIQPKSDMKPASVMIESEGVLSYQNYLFSLNVPLENAKQVIYLTKDSPIVLRTRKKGDWMLVNGVRKKLRRWFIDEKISKKDREQAIIIEQDEDIYGIANLVSSDLSKLAKNDIIKNTLYIKMKE